MPKVDLQDSIAYAIHRTARVLRWHFLSLASAQGTDLTPEQWFILNKLRRRSGVSQTELGESIFADRPNMTRMLSSAERRGLVKRTPDPQDARRILVSLTRKGVATHDRFAAAVEEERVRLFRGLSERDIAVTRRVLRVIEDNIAHDGSKAF